MYYCNSLFKNRGSAKIHVTNATGRGKCQVGKAHEAKGRIEVEGDIECKICGKKFEGEEKIDEYHKHINQEHL